MSNIARTVDELTELAWSEQQRANRAEAEVQRLREAMRTMNVVPAADHRRAVDLLRQARGYIADHASAHHDEIARRLWSEIDAAIEAADRGR